jgi:hypothetical protein
MLHYTVAWVAVGARYSRTGASAGAASIHYTLHRYVRGRRSGSLRRISAKQAWTTQNFVSGSEPFPDFDITFVYCIDATPFLVPNKVLPVANPDAGWKPQMSKLQRLEAYATLHRRMGGCGRTVLPSGSISRDRSTAGEQCSIGFQPVSGFGVETELNPDGPFRERAIPDSP